jgi:hypothetical protein
MELLETWIFISHENITRIVQVKVMQAFVKRQRTLFLVYPGQFSLCQTIFHPENIHEKSILQPGNGQVTPSALNFSLDPAEGFQQEGQGPKHPLYDLPWPHSLHRQSSSCSWYLHFPQKTNSWICTRGAFLVDGVVVMVCEADDDAGVLDDTSDVLVDKVFVENDVEVKVSELEIGT